MRDKYHPGGCLTAPDERGMLGGHGVDIPCHQKPPLGGRPGEDLSVWPTGQADVDDAPCVDLRSRPSKTAEDAVIGILIEEQSQSSHGRAGCEALNRDRRSAFRSRASSRRRVTSVSCVASSASTSER